MQDNDVIEIALDESGNSGNDLLNPDSPILALATFKIEQKLLSEAEHQFASIKADEWKFTKFKRHPKQLNLLLRLIGNESVNSSTVQIHVVHKRFFAVSKFVDLIYEPLARHQGTDLYEQGAALAITNALVTCLPMWLGDGEFSVLLGLFVNLVREKNSSALKAFQYCVQAAHARLDESNPKNSFNLLSAALLGSQMPQLWLPFLSNNELDPLIPSYHSIIDSWGQKLEQPFKIVSDESKTLASQVELLGKLSAANIPDRKLPSVGGRWVKFPYQTSSIEEVNSKGRRDVQLADLFAGAANSVFSALANHRPLEEWQKKLKELIFEKHLLEGGYWPSQDVTPEDLEATHVTGEKAADFVAQVIAQ